jgi:transcriptional regulator with XRE-family HTH domain
MSARVSGADLGRAVRRLRKAHGLKIETLAFAAEMHPTYLSGIERGRRNPTWRKLCGLADALEVSVSTLAAEAEEEAAVARITLAARARLRTQPIASETSPTPLRTPVPARPGA